MENMSTRFKYVRNKLRLTQTEMANKLRVSRSNIASIETEGYTFAEDKILHICNTLNLNENWFRFGYGEMFKSVNDDLEMAYLFGKFTAKEDAFKNKIIKTLLALDEDEWDVLKKIYEKSKTR